jgi:hypothetical protein
VDVDACPPIHCMSISRAFLGARARRPLVFLMRELAGETPALPGHYFTRRSAYP